MSKIEVYEDYKPDADQIIVDDVSVIYTQDADCTEEGDMLQTLSLSTRNNGTARFIHLQTGETGWSVDSADSFKEIFDDFENRAGLK